MLQKFKLTIFMVEIEKKKAMKILKSKEIKIKRIGVKFDIKII